jgi:tetratricopeptide (TPR) repeat protein
MSTKAFDDSVAPITDYAVQARRTCQLAKALIDAGNYEEARKTMCALWQGIGDRPNLHGLDAHTAAEVLLQAGEVTAHLGNLERIPGAQGFAKDLISESIRQFELLGDGEKVAEAQKDLAICYWREGALDEARVWFRESLNRAAGPLNWLRVLIDSTIVEVSSNRFDEALALLNQAIPLLEQVGDDAIIGRYHMQRALVFKHMGGRKNLERALLENAAAIFHLEKAGHPHHLARIENNTGVIFLELKRYKKALNHLDNARRIFVSLNDSRSAAQTNQTRAEVFVAQSRYPEAERATHEAITSFQAGADSSVLAELFLLQGTALARFGRLQAARRAYEKSSAVAYRLGDLDAAGRTALTMTEELYNFLDANEMGVLYERADSLLGKSNNSSYLLRLNSCARRLLSMLRPLSMKTRALRVFLCHALPDKEAATDLFDRLRKEGFDPWLDKEKLLPGQDWVQEISSAIRDSDSVIVCISNRSIPRVGYVQKEITCALDRADEQPEGSIFLIPLRLEPCELPKRLSRWQALNYFAEDGFTKLRQSLTLQASKLGLSMQK